MRSWVIACLSVCLLACVLTATPSPPVCPEYTPCPVSTPCAPCPTAPVDVPEVTPEPHPIDTATKLCLDENMTTLGMVGCMEEAYTAWDAELNRVYQDLLAELPPEQQTALRAAQVAWLAYRDAEFVWINSLYDTFDGTMYNILRVEERVSVVKARALELQSYLDLIRFE